MIARRITGRLGLLVAMALLPGCEPTDRNRSPTPNQDPDRYARALADDRRALLESQEGEARFFRQRALELPAEGDSIAASTSDELTP